MDQYQARAKARTSLLIILIVLIVIGILGVLEYYALKNQKNNPINSIIGVPTSTAPTTTTRNLLISTCVILDEQYCDTGKLVSKNGSYFAGFKLPQGANIYAPFGGVFTVTSQNINGVKYLVGTLDPSLIMPPNPYLPTSSTEQFVALASFATTTNKTVQEGGLLGTAGSQTYDGYNLAISLNSYSIQKKYFIPDIKVFRQYFPNL